MIDKMANVYKKTFSVRSKNKFIALLWGELLFVETCVEQRNVYFTVIGQVFHELWQLKPDMQMQEIFLQF